MVYSADTGHGPGGTGEVLSALRRFAAFGPPVPARRPLFSQPAVPVAASIAAGVSNDLLPRAFNTNAIRDLMLLAGARPSRAQEAHMYAQAENVCVDLLDGWIRGNAGSAL